MAVSSRTTRLHKFFSFILLISLLASNIAAAPLATAQQPVEPVAPAAQPAVAASCAAPAGRVYLPSLFSAGGVPAPANRPPFTRPCEITALAGTPLTIDLRPQVGDPDGDTLSASLPSQPAHGAARMVGLTLHYTPTASFTGTESISYAVSDGRGGSAQGAVAIRLSASPNQAPTAADQQVAVEPGTSATVDLSSLASDPDGDSLSYAIAGQPAHGAATLAGSTLTYTPTAGFTGTDTLLYRVSDPAGANDSATLTFAVGAANRAPQANDVLVTVATTGTATIDLDNYASDPDGDSLSYAIAELPAHGSATLAGSTLTYTPTAGFTGTDTLAYSATDPDGASDAGQISALVVTAGPQANQAPFTQPFTFTDVLSQALEINLERLAFDPEGGPLSFSIIDAPEHGQFSLITTTLRYTPTGVLAAQDGLTFSVTDGEGATALGSVAILPRPTRLHVTPGAVLLTQQGQSVALTVRAYDGQGHEIAVDGLDLEWVSTRPLSVSVAPAAGGAGATVSALTATGSAMVVVRSASDPSIVSALVPVTLAPVKPDVQLVPDSQIVFPDTNPIPNRDEAPFPAGPDGQPIIGAFSGAEVSALFAVVGDNSANPPSVSSFKYAVVLRGPAPAVGTALLASESAPLIGRVTQVAAERDGYALVQVELLNVIDVFADMDWSLNIQDLLDGGLAVPEQFIHTSEETVELGDLDPALAAPFGAQRQAPALAGKSACSFENIFSYTGVEGKLGSPTIKITPIFDGDLQFGKYAEGDEYVSHFKMLLGLRGSLELSMAVRFQPGAQFEIACNLADALEITLPNLGFLTLINTVLGPRITMEPKFEAALKMQGLVSLGLGALLKFGVEVSLGYEYSDPDGFNGAGNWLKSADVTKDFKPFANGAGGEADAAEGKFKLTFQIVDAAKGEFVLGGAILDRLKKWLPEDELAELRQKLTISFLKFKAGLQFKFEWGTPQQVLGEAGLFSASMGPFLIAEASVDTMAFAKALKAFMIVNKLVDIKLFELSVALAPLYRALDKTPIEIKPSPKAKPGDTVTISTRPQPDNAFVRATKGEVFYKRRKIADLTYANGELSGTWKVEAAVCADAESSEDNAVYLEVLGHNTLPNQPLFPDLPLHLFPAYSYLGKVALKCNEFTIELTSTPDLQTLPDETLEACDNHPSLRVPFHLIARDDLGRLESLRISVDPNLPYDTVSVGQDSVDGDGDGETELKIDSVISFSKVPPSEHIPNPPSSYGYTVRATAKTLARENAPSRTKEIVFDLEVDWIDCSEPAITMTSAVAPAPEDGIAYVCMSRNGSPLPGTASVNLQINGRDELAKIDRIELVGTTGSKEVFRKSYPGVARQKTLNPQQTVQISFQDVWIGKDTLSPYVYKFEATIYGLDSRGQPTRIKKTDLTVDVYYAVCEERTEKETRTRTPACQIITEERSQTITVYKANLNGGLIIVKNKEGDWTPWTFVSSVPTNDCSRPVRRNGGDPHLFTPDGLQYDSFALGEFTYLRPRPGQTGLTIQARQERLGTTETRAFFPWTSWNTAIAVEAGGTTFEFAAAAPLSRPLINGQPASLAPGLHSYGAADLNVLSDTAVQLTHQGRTVTVNRVLDFLEISVSVPQDNTHYGMLGTPNGDAADDFRYPDGTPARDAFDMADAWRITDPADSLFTYAPGEGPHTFNLEQINQPPSSAELAPYVDQARELLLNTCRADSLSQVAVNNVALELLTGREPRELASSGLCWFTIEGTVYNSLVPGLPVPGAKVVVTSNQLMTCETHTDRDGRYRCDLAATGELPTVSATVRKRGQGSATVSINELPPMGGYLATELNLSAAPTTLHLNGVVQDAASRPLYNAQLRLAGPQDAGYATAYAQTDGDGRYSSYLMVDDGVLAGQVGYNVRYSPSWSTDPDATGVSQTFTRTLPALRANALNPISETLTLSGGLARFSGRISYQRAPAVALPGLRVRITPTTPVAGWTICDVRTDGDGNYACEVALSAGDPFQVMIEVEGEPMAGPITVDPAGRGVGEVIPVVTNVQLPSGLLQLTGVVSGADGAPVNGADLELSAAGALHTVAARTDASGRYTMTVGLRATASQIDGLLSVNYGTIKRSEHVAFSGLDPAGINQRAHDLTLRGSRLRFSGSVANSFAPGAPLTGTVVISSSAGLLCRATISRNAYECVASLDASGTAALDISYAVSGPWGGADATATLGSLPPLGEERLITRDFSLPLTTLRLTGAVRTSAGAPLAGATVRVASGGVVEGKTGADGRYDLLLTLAPGQDVRGLDYTVLYRTAVIRQSASVTAPAGQLTAVERDLTHDVRPAYFRGTVSNPYGIAMPAAQLTIRSAQLAAPCVTQTGAGGSYVCVSQSQAGAPFTATFTLSGFWGSQTFTETVEAAPELPALDHTADFSITPTVIRLRGVVATPAGAGLAGVEVTAGGPALVREARATTSASGAYELYAFPAALGVPAGEVFTRTMSVRVGYGTTTQSVSVPFAARAGGLTDLSRDFSFASRVVSFDGRVVNRLANNQGLAGSRVTITSPTEGRLCAWDSLERYRSDRYECSAAIFTDQPFEVLYTLDGPWGTASLTGTVTTIPAVGEQARVTRELAVAPTTLHLSGAIADRDGAPLPGAEIVIAAPELLAPVRVKSGADGAYSAFAVVRSEITSATLQYVVMVAGENAQARSASLSFAANTLKAHREDFAFQTARRIKLSGAVRNATLPGLPLAGTITIVSPSLDQPLCAAPLSNGRYECLALVRADGEFTLNYRVEGVWGGVVLQNQTVVTGTSEYVKDLEAAPTVIQFSGLVQTGPATPTAGAAVSIASYDLIPGAQTQLSAVTGPDGRYATAVVLAEGVNSGALSYAARSNGNLATAQQTFAISEADRLYQVAQDLTLTTRVLRFEGEIVNTLVPTATVPQSRVVITSLQHGTLCDIQTSQDYKCEVTLETDQPFVAFYGVTGAWGGAASQTTVATLPAAGEQSVIAHTIAITPSMLRIRGRVLDSAGDPLQGVSVAPRGAAVLGASNGVSDGEGRYEALVTLANVNGSTAGALDLSASYGRSSATVRLPFTAVAGELVDVDAEALALTFDLAPRTLVIAGDLINANAPDVAAARPTGVLAVQAPDGSAWCPAQRGQSFTCRLTLYSAEPVDVVVVAKGDWGVVERRLSITDLPEPGQTATVRADVEVVATTLHLRGRVQRPDGSPLAGAAATLRLEADGATLGFLARTTDSQGVYDGYMVVPAAVSQAALNVRLSYDGIPMDVTFPGIAIAPGQLNEREDSFTFEKRRVRFAGSLTNALVPGMAVPGRVAITSPDLNSAHYCESLVSAAGTFECDTFPRSDAGFAVNYHFSGPWGELDVRDTVSGLPGVGGSLLVEQHAKASPTTIRMVGVVREPSGKPLADAQVDLTNANPGDPGSFQTITVRTDASGRYTATAMLNRDVTAGSIDYRIRYFRARLDATRQYSGLNLNQLNTVAQNFELATRSLTLKGQIEHALVPGMKLRGRLYVASPVHGTLCDQQVGADGTYSCAVPAIATNAFSLTYTLVSDWGTAVFAGEAPAGETGGADTFTKDLLAAPRVLRLRGTIRGADNAPLAGVKIGVVSSDLSVISAATMETDEQGAYDRYVILKADRASGTLTYQLRAGTARGAVMAPYAAPLGQVTTVIKDVLFTSREVSFSGVVRNAYAPAMTIAGDSVAISSPVLGDLCAATSLPDGSYACSLQVLNPESFAVAYAVVGDWGSGAFAGTVGAGSVGGSSALSKDLALKPTTLRLRGAVTDAAGAPLAGATVKAGGANVIASTAATSAEGGAYEIFVMVRAGVELETIEYQLTFGAQTARNRQAYRFESGALTTIAADLTFAVRSFTFKGRVSNELAPGMALQPVHIEIGSPALGTLCAAKSQAGSGLYSCTIELNTRDPFTVTYALSGDWGSAAVSRAIATLPPLGGAATVDQDLGIRPTTLIVRGTVGDAGGAPLAGVATSAVTSTLLSGLNVNLAVQTDANGAYTLPLALRRGVVAGDLAMQFRRGTLVVGSNAAFAAAAGAATEIRRDATIAERQISFRGAITNALANGAALGASRVEVSSPQLGLLCRWDRPSSINPVTVYACDANVGTTGAISLTYTVSGDWGSAAIAGAAPAGPFGGSLTVDQDLAASPTTIRLTGKATNREGAGLPGVVVQATAAGMSSSAHPQRVQAVSGADGSYEALMVLATGVQSGQIQYTARVNDISLFESSAFTATLNDISAVSKNLVFNERSVRFLGNITNQLANNQPLGAYAVEVSNPAMGTLCTARPAQGVIMTSYACEAKISSAEAFTVTYTVTGDWGSQVLTGSVPAGATGGLTLVTGAMALRPTTLRLTGVVSDPYNRRLSSAQVLAGGASVALGNSAPSDHTDGEGAYEFFVALRQGVVTGTLDFTTRYNNAAIDQLVPFEATPGQLTSIEHPVSFTARGASFSGNIKHALLPWMALSARSVVVRDGQGQVLCEWTPRWYESGTYYSCQGQVSTTDVVSATYTINGEWGSETIAGQIPANDYATNSSVARDLLPTPTTLRLRGVARNAGGANLGNVTVDVSGPELLNSVSATTQANGEYEVFALVEAGATGGALSYEASHQSVTVEASATFSAAPRAITPVVQDFTFTSRLVDFAGQVRAELEPELAINAQKVTVDSPAFGRLCEWTLPWWSSASPDYACQATLFTTEPFSVTYTVRHDWGTQVISATAPAGALGSRATFSQNLPVRPSILRLAGTVRNPEGGPLTNARVQVSGSTFSAGTRSLEAYTDSTGAYTINIVLKSTADRGSIDYTVNYQSVYLEETASFTATAGAITPITRSFTVDKRRLDFGGTLTRAGVPGMRLEAKQIAVSSPTLGELCVSQSSWGSDWYSCSAQVATTAPFSVTYTVSGDWGTQVISGNSVAQFPPLGGNLAVERELALSPTTLHLTGTVSVAGGAPLANAQVKVTGPALMYSDSWDIPYDNTDAQGFYDFYVVLKPGVVSDTLTYEVSSNSAVLKEAAPFTAAPGQISAIQRNLTYDVRRIEFGGMVRNALSPETWMAATQVQVNSPTLGPLCAWSYASGSAYYGCSATLRASEPFSVTYTVTGYWGTQVVTRAGSITPPAIGASRSESFNVDVSPAMLRLQGRLTDDAGQPLAGAQVRIYGWEFFNSGYIDAFSDATGRYTTTAVLKAGQRSGSLSYWITYKQIQESSTATFSAAEGAITPVVHSPVLRSRQIQFTGAVTNSRVAGMAVPITQMDVLAADKRRLCRMDSYYPVTNYSCTVTLTDTSPLSVTYVLTGTWGSATVAGAAPITIPAVGERKSAVQNIQVAPTTIDVTGVVRGPDGTPLAGVQVRARSSAFAPGGGWEENPVPGEASVTAMTDASGVYHAYAVAKPGAITGTLSFRLVYQQAEMQLDSASFGPIAADQVTTVSRNLDFTVREILFHGEIFNALLPGMGERVAADAITITDQLGNVLCATEGETYYCSATTSTMAAFPLTYTVAGPWGEKTVSGAAPAGTLGGSVSVKQDVSVSPTTLRLRGTGRDSAGEALQWSRVYISGADVVGEPYGETDEDGRYTIYVPVRSVSGTLNMRIENDYGIWHTASVPFAVANAGGLNDVTYDVVHSSRQVTIRGRIINSLTGQDMESTRIAVAAGGAELCVWEDSSGNDYYRCDAIVTTTAALSVTYAVSGEWGSGVFTGTLPAGESGRYSNLDQDVTVAATALRLNGRLSDSAGAGLGGTMLRITSAAFIGGQLWVYADSNGDYEAFATLRQGVAAGDLRYEAFVEGGLLDETGSFTAQPGQLTEVTRNMAAP